MIDFHGQTAIVTGAGRGLGRLYALELPRRCAAITVNDVGGRRRGGVDHGLADDVVTEIATAGRPELASYEIRGRPPRYQPAGRTRPSRFPDPMEGSTP